MGKEAHGYREQLHLQANVRDASAAKIREKILIQLRDLRSRFNQEQQQNRKITPADLAAAMNMETKDCLDLFRSAFLYTTFDDILKHHNLTPEIPESEKTAFSKKDFPKIETVLAKAIKDGNGKLNLNTIKQLVDDGLIPPPGDFGNIFNKNFKITVKLLQAKLDSESQK